MRIKELPIYKPLTAAELKLGTCFRAVDLHTIYLNVEAEGTRSRAVNIATGMITYMDRATPVTIVNGYFQEE